MAIVDSKLWYIHNVNVLGKLSEAELADLGARIAQVKVHKGEEICMSGTAHESAYVIREGAVRHVIHAPNGKRLTVAILKPGDVIGETALFGDDEPGESAEAMTDGVLYSIPVDLLQNLVSRSPEFALRVTKLVGKNRTQIVSRVQDVLFLTVQERVARLLLRLADEFPGEATSGRRFVNIRLTHAEIAELIGANREAVSACLVRLRKAKLVSTVKGFMVLIDEEGLRREAGQAPVDAQR